MQLDDQDATRLVDMLRHARLARDMLGTRSLNDFVADVMCQLAVVRCIEIIGEAGHRVSEPLQRHMSTVPWHRMWGMRNRLIHDYGHTDLSIVYRIVQEDLAGLISAIEAQPLPPE